MTPPAPPSVTGGAPRWMRIALVLSFGANLLVAGLFAGAFVRDMARERDGLSRRPAMFVRLMPEGRQDEARALMLAVHDEERAIRARMSASHSDVVRAVAHEPFERAPLDGALSERRRLQAELQGLWHAQVAEIIDRMTPEERRELAARFESLATRWAERHSVD